MTESCAYVKSRSCVCEELWSDALHFKLYFDRFNGERELGLKENGIPETFACTFQLTMYFKGELHPKPKLLTLFFSFFF